MIQHLAGHLGTNIFTPFGGIGVTIFLVLSGFGLNESLKKEWNKWIYNEKILSNMVTFLPILCISIFI